MQTMDPLLALVLIIESIVLLCFVGKMFMSLYSYYKLKQQSLQNEIEYRRLETENKNKTVEYSNKVLELIRSIIGQVAVIKFRTFKDTHDLTKITKAKVEGLIKEIAEMSNKSLNMDNIFLNDTFYTKEFVERYIVDTTVILVKQMLDDAILSYDNNETYYTK